MYTLIWTAHFSRAARKFTAGHADLKERFAKTLRDLGRDPLQPSLRLHPLKEQLQGLHTISLTHSYRIMLTLKVTEREIVLLDVGSHDEVYG